MSTGISILSDSADVKAHLAEVIDASDANRSELGFLPRSVFPQHALQGKLWVAVENSTGSYVGHLMFGSRYPDLKVIQLFVMQQQRGRGVGSQLIRALVLHGEVNQYLAITARVASDLPSNAFWKRQGFYFSRQVRGGKTTDRTINIRIRALDVPLLFDIEELGLRKVPQPTLDYDHIPLLRPPIYALDLNTVFDLLRKRERHPYVAAIVRAACNTRIRIVVTDEAERELERANGSGGIEGNPHWEFIRQIPTLAPLPEQVLDRLISELRDLVFPRRSTKRMRAAQDRSDLRHLSSCIHHGLAGFITSERALLQASSLLRERFRLEVISPSEFDDNDHPGHSEPHTVSAEVGNEELRFVQLVDNQRKQASHLLDRLGASDQDLEAVWAPSVRGQIRRKLGVWTGNALVAIAAWDVPAKHSPKLELHVLVDETCGAAERVIDYLLEEGTRAALPAGVCRIHLYFSPLQIGTRELAAKRGFRSIAGSGNSLSELVKCTVPGVISPNRWSDFCRAFKRVSGQQAPRLMPSYEDARTNGLRLVSTSSRATATVDYFALETILSPGLFLYPGRPGIIVPIQETYAAQLLGPVHPQMTLFPSQEALLCIEKAYFRSTAKAARFSKGMIVLFYVSGRIGAIVAVGRITSSSVLTPQEAVIRYSRHGVLSPKQISTRADAKGQIHAFTFDSVNRLPNSVSFGALKPLGCTTASLVGPEPVNSDQVLAILEKGEQETRSDD